VFGSKAKISTDLDILVAGFVCKDFSSLDNSRKSLQQRDESGHTSFSIYEYINKAKPKMVLFENFKKIPWTTDGERQKFEDAYIKKIRKDTKWRRGNPPVKLPSDFESHSR
jgi:site-specific DNA-cytosine methylase